MMFKTATRLSPGETVKPAGGNAAVLVEDFRPTSADCPMTVGVKVGGSWQDWPAEMMVEVMP